MDVARHRDPATPTAALGSGRLSGASRHGLLPLAALLALTGGYGLPHHPGWAAAGLLGAGVAAGCALHRPRSRRFAWVAVAVLAAAGLRGALAPIPFDPPFEEPHRFRGHLAEDPRVGSSGPRLIVDLDATAPAGGGPWQPAAGRVLLQVHGRPELDPALGDRVVFRATAHPPRGFRNPGSGGYAAYLERHGVGGRARAQWPGAVAVAAPGAGAPLWLGWRRRVARAEAAAVPGPAGAILRALTLGDRSGVSPETRDAFRRAGTAHLMAISGLHLGVLCLLLTPVCRELLARVPRLALAYPIPPLARALTLPAMVAYAALAGFQTSTVRALVMTGLLVLGLALSRPVAPFSLLAATAVLLALPDPAVLGDPGVHLSLAALAGLFWLAPRLERRLTPTPDPLDALGATSARARVRPRVVNGLRGVACAGVAATLATAPVLLLHFGGASLAGLILNPPAVPLVGFLCLPLGLAGVVVFLAWPAAAAVLWSLAGAGLTGLMAVQDAVVARLPEVRVPALSTPEGTLGTAGLVIALGLAMEGRARRAALVASLAALVLVVPPTARWGAARLDSRAHLWVFDVGQGQAVGIRLPGARWALVDGGGLAGSPFDVGARVVVPALEHLGARRLWLVASTHPHPDHLGGLPAAVRWGHPERLWLPGAFVGDPRYGPLLAAAREAGSEVVWVGTAGASAVAGDARLDAAWVPGNGENDRSLVLRLTRGRTAALLPADLERAGQRRLLASGFPVAATLLVAPHHGAANALEDRFLRAVRPRLVLVSAGGRPGLPAPAFEATARRLGAEVRSTHRDGCLHAVLGRTAFIDSEEPIW